jgi:hypothetical protein
LYDSSIQSNKIVKACILPKTARGCVLSWKMRHVKIYDYDFDIKQKIKPGVYQSRLSKTVKQICYFYKVSWAQRKIGPATLGLQSIVSTKTAKANLIEDYSIKSLKKSVNIEQSSSQF